MSVPQELFDESHCELCACGAGLDFSISFAFQPIVDAETRTVFAYEALVRGEQGEPAGEVLGRVHNANRYAFDQVCRVRAVKLASRLGMTARLSINFLPNAVYRAEYCIRTTLAAAQHYNFDTSRIIFEVTEGEALTSKEHLLSILASYQQMGFSVALDDFGAGYNRFDVLMDTPPDLLKLDMMLIRNIEQHPKSQAVVDGLLLTCRRLGVQVVAEGIESEAEYDWLRERGVRLFQGYLFARPAFEQLPEVYIPR